MCCAAAAPPPPLWLDEADDRDRASGGGAPSPAPPLSAASAEWDNRLSSAATARHCSSPDSHAAAADSVAGRACTPHARTPRTRAAQPRNLNESTERLEELLRERKGVHAHGELGHRRKIVQLVSADGAFVAHAKPTKRRCLTVARSSCRAARPAPRVPPSQA